jgi:hypothetical protein
LLTRIILEARELSRRAGFGRVFSAAKSLLRHRCSRAEKGVHECGGANMNATN